MRDQICFGAPSFFPTTNDADHDREPGTYTSHLIPHSVGLVVSLNRRSTRVAGAERSISATCVWDPPHSGVSL